MPLKNKFFQSLFGFKESDYKTTRQQLLDMAQFENRPAAHYPRENCVFTIANKGKKRKNSTNSSVEVSAGLFSMPSVAELEKEVATKLGDTKKKTASISVVNMVGEARQLHQQFPHAVIQAASQFNLLEFPSASGTPESGISGYIYDATQGPACAIACAAGTAYRNYLVPVPFDNDGDSITSTRGQTKDRQHNGIHDLETYLMQEYSSQLSQSPWVVRNGYVESTSSRMTPFHQLLQNQPTLKTKLESLLRVGVQEDTTVTDINSYDVTCTQVYSSALSVSYSRLSTQLWEPLAKIVLNATYKATLLVGILKTIEANDSNNNNNTTPILLTKVGAGVFGNKDEWIQEAIQNAIRDVSIYGVDLEIRIVHFSPRDIDDCYRSLETKGDGNEKKGE